MGRSRTKNKSLTNSRIYPKYSRYYLYFREAIEDPRTGKTAKWHNLCAISDGELSARTIADMLIKHNYQSHDEGNMPKYLNLFLSKTLNDRNKTRPTDNHKLKMFFTRNRDITNLSNKISEVFFEFDVEDVMPVDIARFLDGYEDKARMAQVYRSHLSKFFQFACRKGVRIDNPVREVTVAVPDKRNVYITHEQFLTIRDALLTDKNGNTVPTGMMIRCYVDLCYLMYQRLTEVRLLKWDQIKEDGIYFNPTKTEHSSNLDVIIPMTPEIKNALDAVKGLGYPESEYVIITKKGEPYAATGVRTAWKRACERVGIKGLTLKDLRPKSLTDASKAGFELKQISIGAVHADTKTTEGYIKQKDTPVSELKLKLPQKK